MHYTIDSLRELLDSPISKDKWGEDTNLVSAILRLIFSAGCSSCMFKRKVSELRKIFEKHGDTIGGSDYHVEVTESHNAKPSRIPCPDCVAKHLSQAYVLQCEFYQGYEDYIALIEAHLNEAMEECPKDNPNMLKLLNNCLRSVTVDRAPNIPIVLATSLLDSSTEVVTNNEYICNRVDPIVASNLVKSLSGRELETLDLILSGMPDYTPQSSIDTKFDWYGRMSLISDIFSLRRGVTASEIRKRRLKYLNNPIQEDIDLIKCTDLNMIVQEEKTRRAEHHERSTVV